MTNNIKEISAKYTWSDDDFAAYSHAAIKHAGLFYKNVGKEGAKLQLRRRLILNLGPTFFTLIAFSLIKIFSDIPIIDFLPIAGIILLGCIVYLSTSLSIRIYFWLIKRTGEIAFQTLFDESKGITFTFRILVDGCMLETEKSETKLFWRKSPPQIEQFDKHLLIFHPESFFVIPVNAFNFPIDQVIAELKKYPKSI